MSNLCVSYQQSLEELDVDAIPAAYGYVDPDLNCPVDKVMSKWRREGWIRKLERAQADIERDLGAPLCPQEICDEEHPLRQEITLRQAPVAYLGSKAWGDWTETALNWDAEHTEAYIEIAEASLSSEGVDAIGFAYPDDILDCYDGPQELQDPCVTEPVAGTYRFTWDVWQLLDPREDSVTQAEAEGGSSALLSNVKWRTYTIDASDAYEVIGECDCDGCADSPSYTLTLCDPETGKVCIRSSSSTGICTSSARRIRINYATAFDCNESEIDPALAEAVSWLAVLKAGKGSRVIPCSCDDEHIMHMFEIEGLTSNDQVAKMRYGPTRAGMRVMRILDRIIKRPHFNQPVTTAGAMTAPDEVRSIRGVGRGRFY